MAWRVGFVVVVACLYGSVRYGSEHLKAIILA